MSPQEINLNPTEHITADAIGQPGHRVFYLQGRQGNRVITLILEKFQLQAMLVSLEQLLAEVRQQFPQLVEASADYQPDTMKIHPPVDPLFRIGELGLGYEQATDQVVLIARELIPEGVENQSANVTRFWCSRAQVRALSHWGLEIITHGRPICPQCGQPMEPEGHFCPKKNGHKH